MGKVFTHMTMSLDGFIADPHDQPGELFEWYAAGDVTVPNPNEDVTFRVDDASAKVLRELTGNTGALVSGRRLFDIANGWADNHPVGAPVVVVTHRAPEDGATRWPRTTFVDGVEAAIAQARQIAGDQDVVIASAAITQQALDLGLVDEVCVSLVPVLFGEGIPYFSKLDGGHQLLEDPIVVQRAPGPSPAVPSPSTVKRAFPALHRHALREPPELASRNEATSVIESLCAEVGLACP